MVVRYPENATDFDLSDRPKYRNIFSNPLSHAFKVWNSISKIHNNIGSIIFSFDAGKKETYENLTRIEVIGIPVKM